MYISRDAVLTVFNEAVVATTTKRVLPVNVCLQKTTTQF